MREVDVAFVLLPNPQLSDPTMYANLGVLGLGTILRREGNTVSVVDMRGLSEPDPRLIPPARLVGFSATTGEFEYARELALEVRRLWPRFHGARTAIGGAHASLLPVNCMEDFDYVVVGEGETIITDILNCKVEMGMLRTPRIIDSSLFPFPDWNLIPQNKLFSKTLFPGEKYGRSEPAATVIGSRGCPYDCAFCGNILRAPVIYRNPDDVVTEMLMLREYYGIRSFRLEDDNISLNRRWLKSLCYGIRGLHVSWKCHTRVNLVDDPVCGWLASSGCEEVGLGLESADPVVLNKVCKGFSIDEARYAIATIQDHGMRAKVYLVSGLPGETEYTVECNMEFMETAKPDKWTLSMFVPYPGCAIWNNPEKYGVYIMDRDWRHWWNFPDEPVHLLADQSKEELQDRHWRLKSWLKTNMLP